MRVVGLETENFKRLKAVDIRPGDHMVTIGGKNGAGKSSVLDAIWVGLAGLRVAPPQIVRKGEEKCRIRLDLGELIVTRTFGTAGDGKPTDTLKLEDPEGRKYPRPQTVLDELLGTIGFDPFEFVQMKADKQAATLLEMVPLSVDLDELAEADTKDFEARRDINRDVAALKARVDAISVPAHLPEAIDRAELTERLAKAADTNSAIERQRMDRERERSDIASGRRANSNLLDDANALRSQAAELIGRAEGAERNAQQNSKTFDVRAATLDGLPALAEPVDTAALRTQIEEAERVEGILARAAEQKKLAGDLAVKIADSEALTKAMAERAATRKAALGKAKMPIEGLAIETEGKIARVMFNGVPFEQASTAEQLRASTAIAMSANPSLRVLRIKDGSLLDDDSMALLDQMARTEDFQLWVERVGTGGVGIVIVDGEVAAPPEPEEKPKGKAKGPEGGGETQGIAGKSTPGQLL